MEFSYRIVYDNEFDYQKSKKVGCCGVWEYKECILDLLRSDSRVKSDSCDEDDVYVGIAALDQITNDKFFKHHCKGYYQHSILCETNLLENWLVILMWSVGGTILLLTFGGAMCMLHLFITSGSRQKFIVINSEPHKNLINNIEY